VFIKDAHSREVSDVVALRLDAEVVERVVVAA